MNTHEAIKILRNTAWLGTNEDREKAEQAIEVVAEALQQEKRGKWIDRVTDIDARFGRHDFVCSECARFADYFIGGSEDWWDTEKPNYCPHCGADMRGDEQ